MYTYERYSFRIVILVLALVAIAFFVNSEFIGGTVTALLGVSSAFSFQGIIIDAGKQRYLKYDRFLWVKIGKWMPLPPPSYATVVRINLSSNRNLPTPVVPADTKSVKSYRVNLVVEGDQRYVPVCRGSRKEMREEALKLGQLLGIRVLDYTTHEKKWIL